MGGFMSRPYARFHRARRVIPILGYACCQQMFSDLEWDVRHTP